MNIGIDARLLSEKITGINRYLSNLLKYLPAFDHSNKYFLYLYEGIKFDDPFYQYTRIKKSSLPRQAAEHYWLNIILPGILEEQKIDLFFTPYVFVPLKKGNHKNVIVLHDTMTKSCKEAYTLHYRTYMSALVPSAIKRSHKVITVSESARQDIIKYYNVPADKIEFMHLWTDDKYHPRELTNAQLKMLRDKYNLPENFILYVGVIEERKNIKGIINISDILASKGMDINFVLVGKEGLNSESYLKEILNRSERMLHCSWVDEEDLPLLYNMASAFLFPSKYEGFGLPPLEAMKSGTPVLASDNTSLPEVVGNGGLMSNAQDYKSFADNIIRLLSDESFYLEMKTKAIKQAERFTPKAGIQKLISIFNEINEGNN